ncbi:MAG: hypothetical protein K6F52_06420 [Clostridia bacterium]|nr:hypothetical protein [Clostridia bacterium]
MLKDVIASLIYRVIYKTEEVPLTDLFETVEASKYHHIVVALNYIAFEKYYGDSEDGWEFYKSALRKYIRDDSQFDSKWHEQFVTLAESFAEKGYDKRSLLFVDSDNNCINGTHRLALCVRHGVETVSILRIKRKLIPPTWKEQLDTYGLDEEGRARILDAYRKMYAKLKQNKQI